MQWQPQQLGELLVRAAEEGPLELLSQVLGVVPWGVEQLLPLVKGAAEVVAEGVKGRARWRTVKVLLGKQGVGWKAEDLMEVLAAAGRAGRKDVVQQLLETPGVGWRGRTMAGAAAAAGGGRHWDVVLLLLRVVGADWTSRELQGVLDGAAEQGKWQLVMKLLRGALPPAAGGGGVIWLEQQLRRVLEVAAGQGYDNMVRQLLGFREEVVWQAEDLVAAILTAVKYKRWSTVGVLIGVGGVGWGVQQLKGVVEAAAASGKGQLVAQVVSVVSGERWRGEDLAAAAVAAAEGKHWGVLEQLLLVVVVVVVTGDEEGGCGLTGQQLEGVMRAAAGHRAVEVVRKLLGSKGMGWDARTLAAAAAIAAKVGHWEVFGELLRLPGAGWTGAELSGPLYAAVAGGAAAAVEQMLVAVAGGGGWRGEHLAAAVVEAARSREWQMVQQILEVNVEGGWSRGVLGQVAAAAIKAHQSRVLLQLWARAKQQ